MNRLLAAAWLLPWLSLLAAEKPITLWPDGAPGALGTSPKDIPTLTPYLPAKPNGAAMLLIPGGSYSGIYEGQAEPFAIWLNEHGLICATDSAARAIATPRSFKMPWRPCFTSAAMPRSGRSTLSASA